jgi:uncharacterized protein YggT (Ycf19 family)
MNGAVSISIIHSIVISMTDSFQQKNVKYEISAYLHDVETPYYEVIRDRSDRSYDRTTGLFVSPVPRSTVTHDVNKT